MPLAIAQVIFNPSSGDAAQSDAQLEMIVSTLRELRIKANVQRVNPDISISEFTRAAAKGGARFVVASGGDNTIDLVARGLVGTQARLVVVPTGTRNNIARALNIPLDVAEATRLVATGERVYADMGRVVIDTRETYFLELVTIGLGAAMFPAMDDAQHGNLARLGDLLATFITNPPSNFRLNLDRGRQRLNVEAHTMVVLNMPYLGANFQIASSVDWRDGLLDVFVYADLGKLDLLTHAVQVAQGFTDDPRVRHLRVQHLEIQTDPALPVMIDGQVLEAQQIQIHRAPHVLRVMVPKQI
jgi:diacylglycerol kinase (ATP)